MDSFQHEEERVQKGVFEAIESGKIRMRSRWYFALQTMLSVIGGVILGLFLIYIVGFIIFLLRQSGAWFAPGIGLFGWYIFFRSVPWLLVILSLVFLLVLVILINHFSFSYQRPLFYSLIAILVVVAGASIFIANSYDYQQSGPPILGGYYSSYSAGDLSDVHRGEVQILASNGFVLEGIEGETSTVLFGTDIATPTIAMLHAGDLVVVFGDRDAQGFIEASAVEKI